MFNMGSLSMNLKCEPRIYCRLLSSKVTFANDIVCTTNLRHDIFPTCRSKSKHQATYCVQHNHRHCRSIHSKMRSVQNRNVLMQCTIHFVRKLEMNHFCQLCGHYIMLLGLMSLDSVDKVSEHYCPYSMRKQLPLI